MIELHCSALPRILSCPASMVEPTGPRVDGNNVVATIGTCVHEALAAMVRGGQPDIEALCRRHGLEKSAVFPLYFSGLRIWEDLKPELVVITTEQHMACEIAGVHVVGTADIVFRAHQEEVPTIGVLDWKSGVEKDFQAQELAYGVMARDKWPAKKYKLITAMLREGVVDIIEVDADKAAAQLTERLQWAVAHQDHFAPSYESCAFCPRQMECPGRLALVRSSIAELSVEAQIENLSVEKLASLYPKVKFVERICEHYHATIRNAVMVAGPLPVGDGRVLKMVEKERVEILATPEAMEIIESHIPGDHTSFEVLEVNKTKLLERVKSQRLKGVTVKVAIQEFMDELEAAGALSKTTQYTLTVGKHDAEQ